MVAGRACTHTQARRHHLACPAPTCACARRRLSIFSCTSKPAAAAADRSRSRLPAGLRMGDAAPCLGCCAAAVHAPAIAVRGRRTITPVACLPGRADEQSAHLSQGHSSHPRHCGGPAWRCSLPPRTFNAAGSPWLEHQRPVAGTPLPKRPPCQHAHKGLVQRLQPRLSLRGGALLHAPLGALRPCLVSLLRHRQPHRTQRGRRARSDSLCMGWHAARVTAHTRCRARARAVRHALKRAGLPSPAATTTPHTPLLSPSVSAQVAASPASSSACQVP